MLAFWRFRYHNLCLQFHGSHKVPQSFYKIQAWPCAPAPGVNTVWSSGNLRMRVMPEDRGVSRRVRKHELQALWPRQISRHSVKWWGLVSWCESVPKNKKVLKWVETGGKMVDTVPLVLPTIVTWSNNWSFGRASPTVKQFFSSTGLHVFNKPKKHDDGHEE